MKTNKKGFTIVELIIVIAVIGILAAILIPTFSSIINKANAKAAMSDARNALSAYVANVTDPINGEGVQEGTNFIVHKGGKYYGFLYEDGELTAIAAAQGVATEAEAMGSATTLDSDTTHRADIKSHITIYVP